MNIFKLSPFIAMIFMIAKTTQALKCYSCTDCNSNMSLNPVNECIPDTSCLGILLSVDGATTNAAGCFENDFCTATEEQIKSYLAENFGFNKNSIGVIKRRC
ncbi:unnamed protein product, partial [Brachionus calyciflorus]